jgi:prefoldin subunit 5
MSKTTAIEKESLEAHVEICAQRYDALEVRMNNIEKRLYDVESTLKEIKNLLVTKETQAYKKLISIGIAVIGTLFSTITALIIYILKNNLI